jgi:hypothetical protein
MAKIKKEELDKIIEQQDALARLTHRIGNLEYQKFILNSELNKLDNIVSEYKKELEAKYGEVNIDLKDGTYTKIKKEDVKDKED